MILVLAHFLIPYLGPVALACSCSEIKVKITLGKIVGGVTAPIVSKPHDFFMPIFNPLLPPDLASLLTKNNLTFKFVAAEPKAEIMDGYQHRRRRNPFDSRMNRGGRSRGRYDGANVSGPR